MASHFRFRLVFASLLVISVARLGHAQAVATEAPNSRSLFGIPDSDDGLPGAGPIQRADWFRPIWNERRPMWASRVAEDYGAVGVPGRLDHAGLGR